VILVFGSGDGGRTQPAFQQLMFDGERVPVVVPRDGSIATAYGLDGELALFVVSERGRILWRHTSAGEPASLPSRHSGLTRREFVAAMLAASVAATFGATAAAGSTMFDAATPAIETIDVSFEVNGQRVDVSLDPRVTLLDALRERLLLTGTKKGCDHGQCGACTVHVDGRRVLSCLTLAATAHGKRIRTIEGLAEGDRLHPLQQAFLEHDGFQCGYCTSGQIMSAVALLDEPCGPTDEDVRECMSGNICRCGAYPGIVAAVQTVRGGRS
jgi:xanthine dehydrogenase YagT iron-sulfur-binding subunit